MDHATRTGTKTIIVLILIIFFGLCVSSDGFKKSEASNNKVGAILPLSGPAGKIGEEVLQSIRLTNIETLDLRVEDDQCSPKNALSAYEKLNAEGVNIFYVACSGSVMSIYPKAKENGDVILTAYAGSTEIRITDETIIRFVPDGLSIANEMVNYLNSNLQENIQVYMVYENTDYSKSVRDVISQHIKAGTKLIVDTYKPDEIDFKSLALRIKNSNIKDFVFIPGSDKTFKLFLAELQKNAVRGEVVGDVNVCDYSFSTSEFGLHSVCWKSSLVESKTKQYEDAFEKRWGTKSNYTFYNAVTTDVFDYLSELASHGNLESRQIKTKLIQKGYEGVYGSYNFTKDGEIADSKEYLVQSER